MCSQCVSNNLSCAVVVSVCICMDGQDMKNGLFSLFMYIRITGINNKETDKGIRILFSNLLRLYTLAHHTTGHERKLNNNETKKNQNK